MCHKISEYECIKEEFMFLLSLGFSIREYINPEIEIVYFNKYIKIEVNYDGHPYKIEKYNGVWIVIGINSKRENFEYCYKIFGKDKLNALKNKVNKKDTILLIKDYANFIKENITDILSQLSNP
jgi:hypothetical protein